MGDAPGGTWPEDHPGLRVRNMYQEFPMKVGPVGDKRDLHAGGLVTFQKGDPRGETRAVGPVDDDFFAWSKSQVSVLPRRPRHAGPSHPRAPSAHTHPIPISPYPQAPYPQGKARRNSQPPVLNTIERAESRSRAGDADICWFEARDQASWQEGDKYIHWDQDQDAGRNWDRPQGKGKGKEGGEQRMGAEKGQRMGTGKGQGKGNGKGKGKGKGWGRR
jgi:hypothetical protein